MADSKLSSLTASSALTGAELFYSDNGSADVKVTADQMAAYAKLLVTVVVTLTAQAYTTVASDLNKMGLVTSGATDASISMLLPATAGSGAVQFLKKADSGAGLVNVYQNDGTTLLIVLASINDTVMLRCTGSTWVVVLVYRANVMRDNLAATTSPTVTDDTSKGYGAGSRWLNASTGQMWFCRTASAGVAVWLLLDFSDLPSYVANNWYSPNPMSTAVNGGVVGAGSIRLFPCLIKERVTLSALGLRVTTAAAAGNVQAAIYANNPATMRPTGNALASTASMSTTTGTSVNAAVSVQLEPGLYWFATNCDNATAAFTSILLTAGAAASISGSATQPSFTNTNGLTGYSVVQAFSTWPDLTAASFADILGSTVPIVQFKVGSVP